MAIQTPSFIVLTVFSFLISFSVFNVSLADIREQNAPASAPVGGGPVKPTDPAVVAVAKFAVDEYNKEQRKSVKYDHVLKAARQELGGDKYNYALIIDGLEGENRYRYSAVVFVDENAAIKKLIAFAKSSNV